METHTPVLARESTESLDIRPGNTVLDATVGLGGHARELLRLMKRGVFVGIDADGDALRQAERNLSPLPEGITARFRRGNFRDIGAIAEELNIPAFDRVLADLGWGSHHLACGRGFSFNAEEPLSMCYGTEPDSCAFTADEVVNSFEERHLADIIAGYGDERWAKRIANRIAEVRERERITTARQLAEVISGAVPRRFHPKHRHAATKTFQAIRIAVNDELRALQDFLGAIRPLMRSQSRLSIISFHGTETGIVRRTFREWEREGIGKRLTKKPVRPSEEELADNPRSRSAALQTFIHN